MRMKLGNSNFTIELFCFLFAIFYRRLVSLQHVQWQDAGETAVYYASLHLHLKGCGVPSFMCRDSASIDSYIHVALPYNIGTFNSTRKRWIK